MRILFMGTPDIAATCLEALYAAGHEICGVYTRRDKPVGRKQILTAPPVKTTALAHGTPVFQPRTLRDGSEDANIASLAPDIIVVVAYGCILPKQILEMPAHGCINLHVSLLPKYRGSAPVQWAVLNGDAETGVSIMQMDEGLDTGDVLLCKTLVIDPDETSGALFDRVTDIGAQALCEILPAIAAGDITATPQPVEGASHAPMLSKQQAEFAFTEPAAHIHNWIRGMHPWPGAWVQVGDKKMKVTESKLLTEAEYIALCEKAAATCGSMWASTPTTQDAAPAGASTPTASSAAQQTPNPVAIATTQPVAAATSLTIHHSPFTIHSAPAGAILSTKPLTIACQDGAIALLKVVPEGSKPMDGTAFAAGKRLKIGDIL